MLSDEEIKARIALWERWINAEKGSREVAIAAAAVEQAETDPSGIVGCYKELLAIRAESRAGRALVAYCTVPPTPAEPPDEQGAVYESLVAAHTAAVAETDRARGETP